MERPTCRPAKPYTLEEVLDKVYQHFVVDKSPQSRSSPTGSCVYGGTGCAVGCLLTAEDALKWDIAVDVSTITNISSRLPNDYAAYFGNPSTSPLLTILQKLQDCHDGGGYKDLAQKMAEQISDLRSIYCGQGIKTAAH